MDQKDLLNLFCNHLENTGLRFRLKAKYEKTWQQVFSRLPYKIVELDGPAISVHQNLLAEKYDCVEDLSIIIFHNEEAVGIWAINAILKDKQWHLNTCDYPIFQPALLSYLSEKQKKRIENQLLSTLFHMQDKTSIDELYIQSAHYSVQNSSFNSSWYKTAVSKCSEQFLIHDMYIDLSKSIDEISKSFRKSYPNLIQKGLRTWKYKIRDHTNINIHDWNSFKALHTKAAGYETRGSTSWNFHYEEIQRDKGFLVTLHSKELDELIGAAFFHTTSDEGYYSVAAYNRELFHLPIGHTIQFLAIQHLQNKGISYYRIGECYFDSSYGDADKKLKDISFFKKGFMNYFLVRPVMKILKS